LLSERLLDVAIHGDVVVPRWLTTRDHGWVCCLQDDVVACLGLPRSEVRDRLAARPRCDGTWRARQALTDLLLDLHGFEVVSAAEPAVLRAATFLEAARHGPGTPRGEILARVGGAQGLRPDEVEAGLYADLPDARRLKAMAPPISTPDLIERYNLALAQGLLMRAERLRLRADGHFKAVLRFARLMQLICEIEAPAQGTEAAIVRVSGPLSLFRFTTKYGRAMAAWLPALARAPGWSLEAECVLAGERRRWIASHRDPIGTTHVPPRRFDSHVEERLFRDLRKMAPTWQVHREADPVRVGNHIVCPDFTLVDPARGLRIPVEIVGFWTPEYLRDKLAVLRGLPEGQRWVVCIDQELCDRASELPPGPVLPYRGHVDAAQLVGLLETSLAPQLEQTPILPPRRVPR
jgi:predicted nuclease of restriction endonuclease-like RecB superfamily